MDPLLSQYKGIISTMLGATLRSIRTASLATSEAAMYYDLVVESAVISRLELFQLTAPPFNVNT